MIAGVKLPLLRRPIDIFINRSFASYPQRPNSNRLRASLQKKYGYVLPRRRETLRISAIYSPHANDAYDEFVSGVVVELVFYAVDNDLADYQTRALEVIEITESGLMSLKRQLIASVI